MLTRLKQVRSAFSMLNPAAVRKAVGCPLEIGLVAMNGSGYADMEEFLLPSSLPHRVREHRMNHLHRAGEPTANQKFDVVLYEQGLQCPTNAYTFFHVDPMLTVAEVLREHDELGLALARLFPPFRKPVVDKLVRTIARENAMFAIATGLPNIIPTLLDLPWAIGEFASDTAFLTMNQVRMAFLVAGASGKAVGAAEQKVEIASIVGGAFGWRAIARELAGKIPFGGGLIPKGAIAYAATFVIGKGLEKFHDVGRGYSRGEYRQVYESAFEHGKAVVQSFVDGLSGQEVAP
jgi:hypothetical protein